MYYAFCTHIRKFCRLLITLPIMTCVPFPSEFLHREADLTLVPSAAIGRDLEAARVTAGAH